MRVLGIETSCDETGLAVYDTAAGSSRTRCIRRWRCTRPTAASCPSSLRATTFGASCRWRSACSRRPGSTLADLDGIAYTQGPGLAGALLVGASVANALGYALGKPVIGVHHLEGHLLSPLLADPQARVSVRRAARFRRAQPALRGRGRRPLSAARRHAGRCGRRGLRQDGEAPRPALSRRARRWRDSRKRARRRGVAAAADARQRRSRHELLRTEDRRAHARAARGRARDALDDARTRPTSRASSSMRSSTCSSRRRSPRSARPDMRALVVAGGVGANRELRARLAVGASAKRGAAVYFPDLEFCTDNGAMIALVGALRLARARPTDGLRVSRAAPLGPRPSLCRAR